MIILTSKNYFNTRAFKRWIYPGCSRNKSKESSGITGPPSVMWSVDDEIRGMLKELKNSLKNLEEENSQATTTAEELFSKIKNKVTEMFYK